MFIGDSAKIKKAQFLFEKELNWVSFWTCPFFLIRRNLYQNIKYFAPRLKGVVMDFGCGAKPYQDLFVNCEEYIGVDIEQSGHSHVGESVDVYYDGKNIPFENDSIDSIFSSEVYEHIDDIDKIIKELYRVLKAGGYMLVTVPFVWNEHETPYDFKRYTSYGMRALLEKHGFVVEEMRKSTNFIEMIYQMKAEYYRYQFQIIKSDRVRHFLQRTVISHQSFKGIVLGRILPTNWSFYGDNIVLCRKDISKE